MLDRLHAKMQKGAQRLAVTESKAVKTLGWPGPVHQSCPSSCRLAPAIPKIPKCPANPASDHPPNIVAKKITDHPHNPLNHSSDNGSYKPHLRQQFSRHPQNPKLSCKSCIRQPAHHRLHENHSPSPQSLKSQFRQTLIQAHLYRRDPLHFFKIDEHAFFL